MTIDVFIEGWAEHGHTTRKYLDEYYPYLEPEYFALDPKDERGRPYQDEFISDFPSLNCTEQALSAILKVVSPDKEPSADTWELSELYTIRRRLIQLVNIDRLSRHVSIEPTIECRFMSGGLPNERIVRHANQLLNMITIGMETQRGVYWS